MSIAIASLFSPASQAAANSSAPPAAAQTAQPTSSGSADTVELTQAQQVYQLYNQGQRVSQIASSLSLTEAAVNSYLNISNTS
jgi:DNA-binding NarL/FixJ family response regulator